MEKWFSLSPVNIKFRLRAHSNDMSCHFRAVVPGVNLKLFLIFYWQLARAFSKFQEEKINGYNEGIF